MKVQFNGINVLIGDEYSQVNQFKQLVYIFLYAAGFIFKIINNLKAEYISVRPHILLQQNKQERQAGRLGEFGLWRHHLFLSVQTFSFFSLPSAS